MDKHEDTELNLTDLHADIIRRIIPLECPDSITSMQLISRQWDGLVREFLKRRKRINPPINSIVVSTIDGITSIKMRSSLREHCVNISLPVTANEESPNYTTLTDERIRKAIWHCSMIRRLNLLSYSPNILSAIKSCLLDVPVISLSIGTAEFFNQNLREAYIGLVRTNHVKRLSCVALKADTEALQSFIMEATQSVESIEFSQPKDCWLQPNSTYFGRSRAFWNGFMQKLRDSRNCEAHFSTDQHETMHIKLREYVHSLIKVEVIDHRG